MTIIEKFAVDSMGITLTPFQVQLLDAWSQGKTIISPKRAGVTTAQKVMQAWLARGLEEL